MLRYIAAVAFAATVASHAMAQAPAPQPRPPMSPEMEQARANMRAVCGPEIKAMCPGVQGDERRQCMREHRSQLSPPCQQARQAMKEAKRSMR